MILRSFDDMVLLSKIPSGLQNTLDNLHEYCIKWGLSVNTLKTKVVVFRKRGPLGQDHKGFIMGKSWKLLTILTV